MWIYLHKIPGPMGGPMGPIRFISKMCLGPCVHVDLLTHGTWAHGWAHGTVWIYRQNVPGPMGQCDLFTPCAWAHGWAHGARWIYEQNVPAPWAHVDLLTKGTLGHGWAHGTPWIYKPNMSGSMGPCILIHTRYLGPWVGPCDPMDL
jgi:hypothetical protein